MSTMGADVFNESLNSTPNSKVPTTEYHHMDESLSSFSEASPGHAKRALEAHLIDTDRRIQDASRLGTTLLAQKKQLAERLRDIDQYQDTTEVGPDLKQKLIELEKEYNEVGKESARTFLPKSRQASGETGEAASLSADGRSSPSKLQVPSRKSRNQPASRVHDIEFATEISSSLLGQVRHLNSLLAEKEEALRQAKQQHAKLQTAVEATDQRLRTLDDNEQRYKDENWHLETQVQDLTAQVRDANAREQRLSQNLSTAKLEKSAADREYEELKLSHTQLNDDLSTVKRQYDSDIAGLRRNATIASTEHDKLNKKVEELTSQNEELARAVAYRARTENVERLVDGDANEESASADQTTPDPSPPPSPNKGTPRHGGLESETLKSSLHHAHRMIQNLKNNIHREKTEKIELRRMLQDARDELEARRSEPATGVSAAGKRRKQDEKQSLFKKPSLHKLGIAKTPKEEIIHDSSWEEYDESPQRSKRESADSARDSHTSDTASDAFETATEREITSDAAFETATEHDASDAGFETADERRSTTGTEGFQTGAESLAGDSSDELTETEASHPSRSKGTPASRPKLDHRASYLSSASDDLGIYEAITPPRSGAQRYKLKVNRGFHKATDSSSTQGSPASLISNSSQPANRQSLAAELEDLGDDNSSVSQSTPSRTITSLESSPEIQRITKSPAQALFVPDNPPMVDASTLTDPWQPKPMVPFPPATQASVDASTLTDPWEPEDKTSKTEVAGTAVVGATTEGILDKLVGLVRGSNTPAVGSGEVDSNDTGPHTKASDLEADKEQQLPSMTEKRVEPLPLELSSILSQETVPLIPQSAARPQTMLYAPLPQVPTISPASIVQASSMRESSVPAPSISSITPRKSSMTSLADSSRRTVSDSRDTGEVAAKHATPLQMDKTAYAISSSTASDPADKVRHPSHNSDSHSMLNKVEDDENDVLGRYVRRDQKPNSSPNLTSIDNRTPLKSISGNVGTIKPVKTEGTQTSISGKEFDSLMRERQAKANIGAADASITAQAPASGQPVPAVSKSASAMLLEPGYQTSPKRPGSAGSQRKGLTALAPAVPPLPADHKQVIAAASRNSSTVGLSAPGPSSPLRGQNQLRPHTPSGQISQPGAIANSSSPRNRASSIAGRSEATRRSSISSFASEVDYRLNGRDAEDGFTMSNLDPRMIQAITQTMIGEFLWKYTRKPGRGQHSENRHKRFFWIHPYTRTLYWSGQDPSRAGKKEHKAKSVSIQAVRIVNDENPMPPGLHRKSIVIVTPGRTIKFTAPTSGRHETWFNALSYLLLRNGQQHEDVPDSQTRNNSGQERPSTMNSDISEIIPTLRNRSSSRLTTTSRRSLSTVGTNRPSSATHSGLQMTRPPSGHGRLSQMSSMGSRMSGQVGSRHAAEPPDNRISRISEAANSGQVSPAREMASFNIPEDPAERAENLEAEGVEIDADGFKRPALPTTISRQSSKSGRVSSLSNKLRTPSLFASRKTHEKRDSDGARSESGRARESVEGGLAGSITGDGYEHDPNALENVRACCDGKHDVSSLPHRTSHRLSIGSNH